MVEQVVFSDYAWVGLVAHDRSLPEWSSALFDLIPVGTASTDVAALVEALREGLKVLVDDDLRVLVEQFSLLGTVRATGERVALDTAALLNGQQVIFDSQIEAARALDELKDLVAALAPSPTESRQFDESIRSHMAALRVSVSELTNEQLRVIDNLNGKTRVAITGSAGSGKTLVAAEKAIRLSHAGLRTLFLCHNPRLAEHVRGLTASKRVLVRSIAEWVAELNGSTAGSFVAWSHFEEPTDEELSSALDGALAITGEINAVIVDEGQDLRDEWWVLIDAVLSEGGILYAFMDEEQSLLPHRRSPSFPVTTNLSRNCRNSGRVYGLMSAISPTLPRGEVPLERLGATKVATYERGHEVEAIAAALDWIGDISDDESVVVVTAGNIDPAALQLPPGGLVQRPVDWQAAVHRAFEWIPKLQDPEGVVCPSAAEVDTALDGLSEAAFPDEQDVELVRRLAGRYRVEPSMRRRLEEDDHFFNAWGFGKEGGEFDLRRSLRWAPIWASEIVVHFGRRDWTVGIPPPKRVPIGIGGLPSPSEIRVFSCPEFKGLEADTVVVVWDGLGLSASSQLFVAVSRARFRCVAMVAKEAIGSLPPRIRDELTSNGL